MSTENTDTSTDATTSGDRMKDLASRGDSRSQRPDNAAFREFIASGWDETVPDAERRESADFTPERRDALVRRLPGTRLVLPAGTLLEIARWGGHCGFLEGRGLDGYAERWVVERLTGGA